MIIGAAGERAGPDLLVGGRGRGSGHGLFAGPEAKELTHG